MRASGHAAGARVSEPWVCGSGASLFQLAVKAPLALLVCQPERQRSESATSSSWARATSGHLGPLANLIKRNAYLTQRNAFCAASLANPSVCLRDARRSPSRTFSSLICETFICLFWAQRLFNWQIHTSGCASAVGLCPESHRPERQPSLSNSHKVSL